VQLLMEIDVEGLISAGRHERSGAPMPPSSRRHNGGPPPEPRGPGRPGISTSELRERLPELLCEGLPLRAICRMSGMPSREADLSLQPLALRTYREHHGS